MRGAGRLCVPGRTACLSLSGGGRDSRMAGAPVSKGGTGGP